MNLVTNDAERANVDAEGSLGLYPVLNNLNSDANLTARKLHAQFQVGHVNSERWRTRSLFGSSIRWRLNQLFVSSTGDAVAEVRHCRDVPLTVLPLKSLFRLRSIANWVNGIATGQYAAQ